MKNIWFKYCMMVFVASSALMLTGCCDEYEANLADAFPSEAVVPPVMTQPVPVRSSSPQPEDDLYPIHKVVDGRTHSMSVYPTGVASSSLLLIERIAPVQVTLKEEFDYIINITNISRNTLYDVTVTEPYSSIFKYQSAKPDPVSHKNGTLIWNLGSIPAQDTRTITMRGRAIAGGRMSDCVTVTYVPRACIDIDVINPSLKLAQTGPASVIQCDPIPVTLKVTNNGSGLARDVRIREELPKGLLTLDGKSTFASEAGDLQPGESKTVRMKLKASKGGLYKTRAEATAQGNVSATADYSVRVFVPMLVLTTSGPEMRYAGRTVEYEITVVNKGDGPANNLLITDVIPPGATFVSATDSGEARQGMVVWNLGMLKPSASKKVSVKLKLNSIGTTVNKVNSKAYCTYASAESETAVKGIPAILLEVIDLEDPIEIGTNETYVIRVTNQGSAMGTNIVIRATVPEKMAYVNSSGPTRGKASGNIVSFEPLASLAAKATAEYRIQVKGLKIGDLRFGVELQSEQMSSPVMETESTHVY